MVIASGVLTIIVGYLLGSIPSACLMGRLKGVDMREVGNGRIGASAVVRRLGLATGFVVAFMDFGKGMMTVACAKLLNAPLPAMLLAGLAAVMGHNWSIFLRFRGGRGALTSYGVLASLALPQFLIAAALTGIFYFVTRRTTLATVVLYVTFAILLWAQTRLRILSELLWTQDIAPLLIVFPLFLLIPMLFKRSRK